MCISKGRSSLCILKNLLLGLLMQTCFLHKFSLMTVFFIVEERLQQHQAIKKRLMDSLVYNENIDTEDLNERANIVESSEEAMDIIKEYKYIIKTNKKNIIFYAYQQGKVFIKFNENGKSKSLVEQFEIPKGTIIFKINIVRLADKYPKMMILSVTLNFLKSYYLDIKNICKENHEDFK